MHEWFEARGPDDCCYEGVRDVEKYLNPWQFVYGKAANTQDAIVLKTTYSR